MLGILSVKGVSWDEVYVVRGNVHLYWRGWEYVFRYYKGYIPGAREYYYKVAEFIRNHQYGVSTGEVSGPPDRVYVDDYVARQEGGGPVQRGSGLDDSFGLGLEGDA